MRFVLSPKFKWDLEETAAWIAQDSPARALRVVRELRAAMCKLAENPLLYRVRPEIGDGARIAVCGHHVIVFCIDGDVVRFERVVYAGRDLQAL